MTSPLTIRNCLLIGHPDRLAISTGLVRPDALISELDGRVTIQGATIMARGDERLVPTIVRTARNHRCDLVRAALAVGGVAALAAWRGR